MTEQKRKRKRRESIVYVVIHDPCTRLHWSLSRFCFISLNSSFSSSSSFSFDRRHRLIQIWEKMHEKKTVSMLVVITKSKQDLRIIESNKFIDSCLHAPFSSSFFSHVWIGYQSFHHSITTMYRNISSTSSTLYSFSFILCHSTPCIHTRTVRYV